MNQNELAGRLINRPDSGNSSSSEYLSLAAEGINYIHIRKKSLTGEQKSPTVLVK